MKWGLAGVGIALSTWLVAIHQNLPLLYTVIGLALLDMILNIHQESLAIQKMGKGLIAVLLPVVVGILGQHFPNPEIAVNTALVVVAAMQLSSVGPRLIEIVKSAGAWLTKELPKKDQAIVNTFENDVVNAISHLSPEALATMISQLQTAYAEKTRGNGKG